MHQMPFRGAGLALSAVLLCSTPCPANTPEGSATSARTILDRAIEAHGGQQSLAKLKSARRVIEGTFEREGGSTGEMRLEMTWQLPDRIRSVQTIELPERGKIQIVKILNGDQGWFQVPARDGSGTRTIELDGDRLQTLNDEAQSLPLPNLTSYLNGDYTLSSQEPAEVNGKPADGVLIKSDTHGEVKLWFDRETGLLAKQQRRTRLISNEAATMQENIYADYRDHDGLQYWSTVTSRLDGGDRVFEGKVATLELEPKFGADVFDKPEE